MKLLFFVTEKSLVDCAYNLRAELENAASDVSGLFSKIGLGLSLDWMYFVNVIDLISFSVHYFVLAERKDKIEDGNQSLVQRFRSQLTDQLDALHKTVSSSVMQQEDHLKEMEDDMQSFVSSKDEAIQSLIVFIYLPTFFMKCYVLTCMN